jgi:serine/threonine protein kinase
MTPECPFHQVQLIKRDPNGRPDEGEVIGTKGAGEHLGEKSLLDGSARDFDALVISKTCRCAYLDQTSFVDCMGPISEVLKRAAAHDVRAEDLIEHRILGMGTFGKVKLVKDRTTGGIFAMKVISKAKVVAYHQQDHVLSEKQIMAEIDHPFCIQLITSFKSSQRLYMVLEYCPGGELFTLLQAERKFTDPHACFYASSVMLAFEYLHDLNIIYRDLKPENLLLDARGFCKVCDFGFAKKIVDRTWTLCGTPEYLAPELIRSKGHGKGVDWWALGILIYEMLSGFPPYGGDSPMATYKLILDGNLVFPEHVKPQCRDLIRNLVQPTVSKRLGCLRSGSLDVKTHSWFGQIDLLQLIRLQLQVPHVPKIKGELDTSNFPHYDDEPDEPYEDDGTGWDDPF